VSDGDDDDGRPDWFSCPECAGFGTEECDRCGAETTCGDCDGTGLDDEVIDVEAMQAAMKSLGGATWELLGEGLERLGRQSDSGSIRYEDFRRGPG
jgi:hypothetical protein